MKYQSSPIDETPIGFNKILSFNWPIAILLVAVSSIGFLMLFSVADGDINKWTQPQIFRFAIGLFLMMFMAFVPINYYKGLSILAYIIALILLLYVEFAGDIGKGAQRWINLGFMRLQPSELMKISLVMILALYYSWIKPENISKPLWVLPPLILAIIPMILVLKQPDLGTAILLFAGAAVMMFAAGVSIWYFAAGIGVLITMIYAVFATKGTSYALLSNYQYRRIDTFLDPSQDPLNAGYNLAQSKIALGSGGGSGQGFMQGTQSYLNFLPEKHTDFIFPVLAQEFGFIGGITLLLLYFLIIIFCISSAISNTNRFGALLTLGISATFFFYFAVNMAMVMGLAPVVGVPLPLVSYGGSAMLVLMAGFGLIQSAHIHRPQ